MVFEVYFLFFGGLGWFSDEAGSRAPRLVGGRFDRRVGLLVCRIRTLVPALGFPDFFVARRDGFVHAQGFISFWRVGTLSR